MRFGCGTNVVQYLSGVRAVSIGARNFIVLQHAVREFDIECRPGRTPLVGRSRNLVDHLVPRIICGDQEVRCIRYSKPRLRDDEVCRGCKQRAFAIVAQIPKSAVDIDEIQGDGRRWRFAGTIQGMPDIALLAEQPQKLRFILREFASELLLQLRLADRPELYAAQKRRVDTGIGDKTPAFGAGVCCRRARCGYVTKQVPDAAMSNGSSDCAS